MEGGRDGGKGRGGEEVRGKRERERWRERGVEENPYEKKK